MPSFHLLMSYLHSTREALSMTDISHPAPDFSAQEAEVLAQLHFGVTASASPLDSERDRNFRLRTGNGSGTGF